MKNPANFNHKNINDSPDPRSINNEASRKFASPLKTQKNSSGCKLNFSNKKIIPCRNEKEIYMQIQPDNQQLPLMMNRYNSQILEQQRTQRVSPQFVKNSKANEHPSIQQNGSAKSYSFQARSPLRQQITRTPLKDTHINIGSNSRQGIVNFSPCPIRYMQMQSSQKPLLNLGRNRMDSQGQPAVGGQEQEDVSDQAMSVGNKNSPTSVQSNNQKLISFPNTSSKHKNCNIQYYSKQNKMNVDTQNLFAQGIIDSTLKQKAQIKLTESKKFLFSQNYFSSPFKNKSQNVVETPVKEGQNLSSQKNQQNTLRGYQIISSSKKNQNPAYDQKLNKQKVNLQQNNLNFENEDEEKDNRLSSNTTKKQFVTKFKGGSQVKSNFKLNQNSLQVKEYECMMNQKRATDSKNYKMFLQDYENDCQQNENININNIHFLSNNKNSERQSGRSNYHHTINSLSQNILQKNDELVILVGSNKNLKHHQKQEFSPCRKFMHQDTSMYEKDKKNNFGILNNNHINNNEQPIISPNFNFKGKIDSKASKGLGAIKFDSQNAESPLSQQKRRKGLFIDQNMKNRFDHQQIVNNMKREFVEDPKKYENQKWLFNQFNDINQKMYDPKKEGFNPFFFHQPDFNMSQNMHQMMFNYQNQFHGIKQKNNFYSNFEQADIVNQKHYGSYSKKKKKHQSRSSQQQFNNSQYKNKQMNNYNHDSAQKLLKDKNYINSNTKEEISNEVQEHNKMIPLICPSTVNVGGRMNEAFRMAQKIYQDKKMLQQSSISPTSLKKSKIFCNNSGTTIKRYQCSIQETDSGQKNIDKNQIGSSGGKEYGHSGFQQTPSDMQDIQSSSNDEEGEDEFEDEEECSSSQPTSGDKSQPHFFRRKSRKYEYEMQQYYLHCLQQQENYNLHYQHFQKDNFRIHMDGIFSASYIPRQQYPSYQYSQFQANFINHFQQQQNQNLFCQQNDKQKYKSNLDREDGFLSNNKIQKDHDQENEKESFRIPLITSKREQIKSPCYQKNFQSNSKNDIKNPEIEISFCDQEIQQNSQRKEQIYSQKKLHNYETRNSKRHDIERECIDENKSGGKKGGDVGQINIICPMINHYCSHSQQTEQGNNRQQKNNYYGQQYQQKFQNNYINGFPFHNQMPGIENQGINQFQYQIMQNQYNSFFQNNQFNQNQNLSGLMGFNNQFGPNFLPGFGNNFINGTIGQNQYYPQIFPQSQMGFNNFMQQSESNINLSNQINGLSENKNKNDQKKINLQQDSQMNQNNNGLRKNEEDIDQNLGKRSFQTMNNNNQIDFEEKIQQKRKRYSKVSKQEQINEQQQSNIENQSIQQQSPKLSKRRKKSQKNENINLQNHLQDVEDVSESQDLHNLHISFQNTFTDNTKNHQESSFKNNQITQSDVFDKPDDPKETRTIKKKSGIDQFQQSSISLMQKTFFHITPQKSLNMGNNSNRVGGTAPHYHSNNAQSTQITPIRNNNNSQQKSAQYINMPIFDPCSAPSGDTLKDEDAVIMQPDDQMTIGQGGSVFLNQNDQEQNFSQNQYYQDKDQNINRDDINTDFQSNIFQQNQYSIQFISKRDNNLGPRKKQRQFSSKRSENFNEYGGQLSVKLAQQQKDFLNKQNEANIQKMIERIELETIDQKELFRKIENGETTVTQCKGCKCKGQCLKLYCECLRNNALCGQDCQCTHNGACFNNLEHKQERRYAIEQILKRNINAFDNKVDQKNVHSKGCNCKNSGCQKRYCECYERNVPCTDKCKCKQCKNDKIYSSSVPENECQHHFLQISEDATFQVNYVTNDNQQYYQNSIDDCQFKQNQKNKDADKLNLQNYQVNNNGNKIFQLVENNNLASNQKSQLFESQKQKQNFSGNINEIDKKSSQNRNLENEYHLQLNDQNNQYDIEQLQSNEVLLNFQNTDNQQEDQKLYTIQNGNITIDSNESQLICDENLGQENNMVVKAQQKKPNQQKHFKDIEQVNCSLETSKIIVQQKQLQNNQLNYTITKQNENTLVDEKEDDSNLVTFNNQLTILRQTENNQSENSHYPHKLNTLIGKQNIFETKQDLIRKKQKKRGEDLKRVSLIAQQESQHLKNENQSKYESLPSDNQILGQQNDEFKVQEIEQFQTPGFSNLDFQNGSEMNEQIQNKDNIKVGKFNHINLKHKNESPLLQGDQNQLEFKNQIKPFQKKDQARSIQRLTKPNEQQKPQSNPKQSDIQTRQMRNIQHLNDDQYDPIILEIQLKHEDFELLKEQDLKEKVNKAKSKSRQKNLKFEKMLTRHQRKLIESNTQNLQTQDQQNNGNQQ